MDGRCENKYLLTPQLVDELLPIVSQKMLPDRFSGGKPYFISSIYFDDATYKLQRMVFERADYRYKLRLRVYGDDINDSSMSFFEIKSKLNGRSVKQRLALPLYANELLWQQGIIPDGLSPDKKLLAGRIVSLIRNEKLSPAAYVGYQRIAFAEEGESELRVTFDSKLIIRTTDLDLRHGRYGDDIMGDTCILELKSGDNLPKWLTTTVGERHLHNVSYSKYGKTVFAPSPVQV